MSAPPNRPSLVPFGVILALALLISTNLVSKTFERIKFANKTITVKGYAEKPITSDWATWSASFSARADTLADAYAKLEADLPVVLAYLAENSIPADTVDLSAVHTDTLYKRTEDGRETNEIEGYRLSRYLAVSSPDVDNVSRVARESTALIKNGVEFYSQSPEYIYTKIEDIKIEMLALATRDARRRAETLAENSACKVGPLRSAQQGVFQITSAFSTSVSDYGRYDTSTIDKSIKAVVTVDYSIE